MKRIHVIFLLFLVTAMSCDEKEIDKVVLREYPDHYSKVFNGSKIKSLTSINGYDNRSFDTLHFDTEGRLIKKVDGFSTTRWAYDSNNYIRRLMHESDYFDNQLISHQIKSDTLYEYWIPVKSPKWEFKRSDLDSSRMNVNKYLLEDGLPIKFISSYGHFNDYGYDESGQITKVEKYSKSGELAIEVTYKYDEGELKEVVTRHVDGKFYETIYFSDGFLDSIVDIDFNRKYTVLEKYPD